MANKIKFKIHPITNKTIEVDWIEGKTIQGYLDDFLAKYPEREIAKNYFKAYIDGQEFYRDYWEYAKVKPNANVLIAVVPQGGDFGQIFGQALVIAAVAASVYVGGPAVFGLSPTSAFLLSAAVGISATLLVNALIPPPTVGSAFVPGGSIESSQMYSISGQSNALTKFGIVPKVYGNHRIFPRVAANPYTQVEADNTGEFVQFFYAIYDLGFGPGLVGSIKIGETPISNYSDVEYRIVDLNRPGSDEGVWDENLFSDFKYYKSDVSTESISVALNKNENDPGVLASEFQAVRSAAPNTASVKQEINVDVAFPQGLTTFGSNGSQQEVNVEFLLEFRPISGGAWFRYDDLSVVDSFKRNTDKFNVIKTPTSINGNVTYDTVNGIVIEDRNRTFFDTNPVNADIPLQDATILNGTNPFGGTIVGPLIEFYGSSLAFGDTAEEVIMREYKIKKGVTTVWEIEQDIQVGNTILIDGQQACEILTKTAIAGGYRYTTTPSTITKTLAFDLIRVSDGKSFYKDFLPSYQTVGYSPVGELPFFFVTQDPVGPTGNGLPPTPQSYLTVLNAGFDIITGNQQNPLFRTFSFAPKTLESIEIRLTRKRTFGGADFQRFTNATLVSITTKFDTEPIVTNKRHLFLEIRIKATDQLNGAIQNLSAVVQSALDVYDPNTDTWVKQITNNPAWVFADLLTGEVNKRAIDKSRLDTDSLVEWANYCDEIPAPRPSGDYSEVRFQTNFILDFSTTLQDLLLQMSSQAQATMNIVNGKYGVLIDKEKTIPVQMFTPRNSSNFSSSRKYAEVPDALKIKFIDPAKNWELNEIRVFNDGFDVNTFVSEDELEAFATTNAEQAFRFGRYMLAQARLRQENISIVVGFEHLVCTRGDYVLFVQDVMKVGGLPMRVNTVDGIRITTDDDFSASVGPSYGYRYRANDGTFKTSTLTVIDPNTFDLNGDIPAVDDLIVIGIVGQLTYDCIVKSIEPNGDLTATLNLVEKNDAIFNAESTDNWEVYDPRISGIQDAFNTPPLAVTGLSVDDVSYDCDGATYAYFVDISWEIPAGTVYELFEIYRNSGAGFDLVGTTRQLSFKVPVESASLGTEHSFKVLAVNANGVKLNLNEVPQVTATPTEKTTPPSDVNNLFSNITNQVIQLDWDLVDDCDIAYYEIRYSPNFDAKWSEANPITQIASSTPTAALQARVGSYFVKAYDFNGNQSENAATVKTSIPNLIDLNVIEETTDFDTFPLTGTLQLVEELGSSLLLKEQVPGGPGIVQYYSEGEYLYDAFLDLGDVYTARLQSLIDAIGYTKDDIMSSWVTLSSVGAMSTVDASDFAVETYNRRRDSIIVMSNWATLTSVAALSTGSEAEWTPWEKFTIGDFTGRIFQFKLVLKSLKASVTPRVYDAKIKSDMPDRAIEFTQQVSNAGSVKSITYSPGFYGPGSTPFVGVSLENGQRGDRWQITNRNLDGFDIEFFDENDVSVQRTFDVSVKGFGAKAAETI